MYLVKIANYNIQYVTIISSNRARGFIWRAYNSSSGILIFHNHYLKEKRKISNWLFFFLSGREDLLLPWRTLTRLAEHGADQVSKRKTTMRKYYQKNITASEQIRWVKEKNIDKKNISASDEPFNKQMYQTIFRNNHSL